MSFIKARAVFCLFLCPVLSRTPGTQECLINACCMTQRDNGGELRSRHHPLGYKPQGNVEPGGSADTNWILASEERIDRGFLSCGCCAMGRAQPLEYCVWVCALITLICSRAQACYSTSVTASFLLLPCGTQRSNSGCQVWQQAPVESSHRTLAMYFCLKVWLWCGMVAQAFNPITPQAAEACGSVSSRTARLHSEILSLKKKFIK